MSETYDNYEDWEDEGQDSPVALVGILVMALTSAAIVANALFMQPKSAEIELINRASKQAVSQQTTGSTSVSQTRSNTTSQALINDQAAMVLAVQRQLTMAGYYVGPLDGKEGGQTREAVIAYQDAMGMPATGKVSAALHDVLTGRKTYTANTPAVDATEVARVEQAPIISALPRSKPVNKHKPKQTAKRVVSKPIAPAPKQIASRGPVPPESIPEKKADPILAKVQSALKRFGYGDLTVDGLMGGRTSSAIADFQRSRGHPVTGKVNDRLLQEMMIMGYLDLG